MKAIESRDEDDFPQEEHMIQEIIQWTLDNVTVGRLLAIAEEGMRVKLDTLPYDELFHYWAAMPDPDEEDES